MSVQVLVSSELTKGKISGRFCKAAYPVKQIFYIVLRWRKRKRWAKICGVCRAESLEELRAMDAEALQKARMKLEAYCWKTMKNGLILVPNADGYVLKDTVKNIWKNGKMHHIPYMVGSTGNDLGMSPEEAAQEYRGFFRKRENSGLRRQKKFTKIRRICTGLPISFRG